MVSGAVITTNAHDLIIATTSGQVIRIAVETVKKLSRQASGVILIRMNGMDRVSTMTVVGEEAAETEEANNKQTIPEQK